MEWILILAFSTASTRGGVSIEHIKFSSAEQCVAAGRGIAARVDTGTTRTDTVKYFCAPNKLKESN